MFIGWTTVANRGQAEELSQDLLDAGLAACVQIDGPVTSIYRWQGKCEKSEEFRLSIKFLPEACEPLSQWINAHHPYETPEWIVVRATEVGEKYLSWAQANSTNPPL